MIEGVKQVTGFIDSEGPMVRVQLESGSTFTGPLLQTMAELLQVGHREELGKKKAHLTAVGK